MTTTRQLQRHEIQAGDVILTVQACDETYANIGIFRDQRSTYYHVDLPSLDRQWRPASFSPTDLGPVAFDAVMADHRDAVLALIDRLNAIDHPQMALPLD